MTKQIILCYLLLLSQISIAKPYSQKWTHNELSADIAQFSKQNFPVEQQKVKRFLGYSSYKILMEAEQINGFLLDPFRHDGETFGGFSIRKKTSSLTAIQSMELKKILSSDANYAFDNMMKNCTFTPKLGLEFRKGTQILRILISYDCRVWRFVGEGINKEEDFDPSYELMLAYLQKIFPNDSPRKNN